VLDSTVLVSAFLTPGGAAHAVMEQARQGRFLCISAADILAETRRVLLDTTRLRQRYPYEDADVVDYIAGLQAAVVLMRDVPPLSSIVRDPNDDMIVACAVAAQAGYVVTRDLDLLSLQVYAGIHMITPEAFLAALRERESREGL
jgi:putative PIN family toxin of toxin-antitoxin system